MSTATISRPMSTGTRTRTPAVRPSVRRPVPAPGPPARPVRMVLAPTGRSGHRPTVRSCQVDPVVGSSSWRLTDRGIAVVLVLTAMIVVAAVAVIGLTAWRVTGSDYDRGWSTAVSQR